MGISLFFLSLVKNLVVRQSYNSKRDLKFRSTNISAVSFLLCSLEISLSFISSFSPHLIRIRAQYEEKWERWGCAPHYGCARIIKHALGGERERGVHGAWYSSNKTILCHQHQHQHFFLSHTILSDSIRKADTQDCFNIQLLVSRFSEHSL